MKALLGLFLFSIASVSFASETCTFVIKDRYGYEYENHTRYSYSKDAACGDASWSCEQALANARAQGRYYDATCEMKYDSGPGNPRPPFPPTATAMCTTDLVDYYGTTIRSFSGSGRTEYEACRQSDEFCSYELNRGDSRGRRCVRRGNGGGYPQPPRPPRETTESCTANRYDPAGFFIESYYASHTGPVGSDVRGAACRKALNNCSYEIRGRQTCRL